MKERIQELKDLLAETKRYPEDKMLFLEKQLDLISDLVHKVEQFEPEEITSNDVNKYYIEEDKLYADRKGTSFLQEVVERDKLARELVEAVLTSDGLVGIHALNLAMKLKEKLDAPTK